MQANAASIFAADMGVFTAGAIAGLDEAGAGALAGPVVAAAVVADGKLGLEGVCDSKVLSPSHRLKLAVEIKRHSAAWAVSFVSHQFIDEKNILQARLYAMELAILALGGQVDAAIVDGNRVPRHAAVPVAAIVDGDRFVKEIAAASILAKVARDAFMRRAAVEYPGYGFEQHFGYGTELHLLELARIGPSLIHRRSFAPLKNAYAPPLFVLPEHSAGNPG